MGNLLQAIFRSEFLPKLVSALANSESSLEKEILDILSHLLSNCQAEHYKYFENPDLVEALCGVLQNQDKNLNMETLTILAKLLDKSTKLKDENQRSSVIRKMLTDCDGDQLIVKLSFSCFDESVKRLAQEIAMQHSFQLAQPTLTALSNSPDQEDADEEYFEDDGSENAEIYGNDEDSFIDD